MGLELHRERQDWESYLWDTMVEISVQRLEPTGRVVSIIVDLFIVDLPSLVGLIYIHSICIIIHCLNGSLLDTTHLNNQMIVYHYMPTHDQMSLILRRSICYK